MLPDNNGKGVLSKRLKTLSTVKISIEVYALIIRLYSWSSVLIFGRAGGQNLHAIFNRVLVTHVIVIQCCGLEHKSKSLCMVLVKAQTDINVAPQYKVYHKTRH